MKQPATLQDLLIPPSPADATAVDSRLTVRFKSPETKEQFARICARHGTNPSAYLDRVAATLVDELGE